MMDKILTFDELEPRMWGVEFSKPISFEIKKGEQWAVLGENGSGKSMLLDIVSGKIGYRGGKLIYHFFDPENRPEGVRFGFDMVKRIAFESAYKMADYNNMYYQQRFNATENDFTPTVSELLDAMDKIGDKDFRTELSNTLNLEPLMEKHLIMMSSGELRRFLIAATLLQRPSLLLIDNPFIGLDKGMKAELNAFFTRLAEKGWQMLFAVPADAEVPDCVTHILPVKNLVYGPAYEKKEGISKDGLYTQKAYEVEQLPKTMMDEPCFDIVAKFTDINISYPSRTLFKDLNWTIKKGEKWSLSGQNGAGKSTLLSLLAADNPRAYSQDIILFDKKRGTGESIWDIKKHIGYISSEMHLFFREDQSCLKIVASGFYDTIGLFRKPKDEHNELAIEWMKLFGIDHLANQSFLKVSGGEQRLILLCRTMVKNPDLLILDEPLHGLDMENKKRARKIIEKFAEQPDKTMIYVTHREEEIPSCVNHHFELLRLN